MRFTRKVVSTSVILTAVSLSLSSCSGVSLVKQGEEDALSACEELLKMQDAGEGMSIEAGMAALFSAEIYAQTAAEQNDDYIQLSDAISALADSLAYGSEAMANTAWGSVANICNSL